MSRIILIRGKAGVGKTTISDVLSHRLGLVVIHKDDIYDELANTVDDHQKRNEICGAIIMRMIENCIKNECDLLIDSSYHYRNQITEFKNQVEATGGVLKTVLLTCSNEEVWKKRFETRKENPKPNNLIVDFNLLKQHYKTLHTEPILNELIIDTAEPLERNISRIMQWLDSGQ